MIKNLSTRLEPGKYIPKKERLAKELVYILILVLLSISFSGISSLSYAIYMAPIAAFFIWSLSGNHKVNFGTETRPFIFLIFLALLYAPILSKTGWKQLYFVFVYSSIFVAFDFSRFQFKEYRFFLLLVGLSILLYLSGRAGIGATKFSIVESKSPFENTLAFAFGLFAIYFLIKKKWIWFILAMVIFFLSLKRIAIGAVFFTILLMFLPLTVKKLLMHPVVISICVFILISFSLMIADGVFEKEIRTYLNISSGQLLMGREKLWSALVNGTDFSFFKYIIIGEGFGEARSIVAKELGLPAGQSEPIHSDFLALTIELGIIPTFIFCLLLNWTPTIEERYLTVYLTILMLTDNILIYQHVMIPALLLITSIRTYAYAKRGRKFKKYKRQPTLINNNIA